jgi:transcriptional regulator with XRE-family HTH domain
MHIGDRLKWFRELKNLSQGDIEKRTGLLRCYISRVECGHTIPSIETLEKITRALEISMYQLFYDEQETLELHPPHPNNKKGWTSSRSGQKYLARLTHALPKISEPDRALLIATARLLAHRSRRKRA